MIWYFKEEVKVTTKEKMLWDCEDDGGVQGGSNDENGKNRI